jgi:transposase InsO family protein
MLEILHLLATFVGNLFRSRRRLEIDNLFLRHQLNIAMRRAPRRLQLHGSLFAFLVVSHGRRQLLWFAVTRHPTADWLAQQIAEAFPWDMAPRYLIRDNDSAYGQAFTNRVRRMGIRDRPIAPRSPWQNSYIERLIGTLRRECLDHILIFGERHLRRVLTLYALYYNETRTHLGLAKDAPLRRAVYRCGDIVTTPILSGLHHRYARI